MDTTLSIRLLGEFELRREGALVPLVSARAQSLLAYLLLHRTSPQPREQLAFLLWPDLAESQARTNLRHLLHQLKCALPDVGTFLEVTPQALRWRSEAPFWCDVAAFEAALARAELDTNDLEALEEAARVYAGDLLEGCYDEWLMGARERLKACYLGVLERLAFRLEADGEQARAIPYAERLLRYNPLHEETYRCLMRLYAARGNRARAASRVPCLRGHLSARAGSRADGADAGSL